MVFPAHLQAADTTVGVQVCNTVVGAPSVTDPAVDANTTESSITVSGTGPASTAIYHFRNGSQVGFVTSAGDGSYSLSVPLVVGSNVLHTSVLDECNQFVDSPAVTITRTAIPSTNPPDSSGPAATTAGSSPATNTTGSASEPAAAPATDASGLVTPVIDTPKNIDRLNAASIVVTGRAKPLTLVKIYLNGKVVAEVLTDDQGRFSVSVSLAGGENHLVATSGEGDSLRKSLDVRVFFEATDDVDVINNPWWLLVIISVSGLFIFYLLILRHLAKNHFEEQG
jgi:hypothetical protein